MMCAMESTVKKLETQGSVAIHSKSEFARQATHLFTTPYLKYSFADMTNTLCRNRDKIKSLKDVRCSRDLVDIIQSLNMLRFFEKLSD